MQIMNDFKYYCYGNRSSAADDHVLFMGKTQTSEEIGR